MNICPGCGAENQCAITAGAAPESCWCFRLPFGLAERAGLPSGSYCYCETCLSKLTKNLAEEKLAGEKSDREPE
ncbi:cysteine-rich CWC family protein [Rheinheimera sp.]|uniref:cysteine-rich CWC family protein n=1 Tax=Rheinheimera sp. TaxID=1869214 RepID=UPI0035A1C9B8